MRWRDRDPEPLSTEEAFQKLTVPQLKGLARLLAGELPPRKPELVALLARTMRQPRKVQKLYEQLDPLGQAAVQEAAHHPKGWLEADRFEAKYGSLPQFYQTSGQTDSVFSYAYYDREEPMPLALFFPQGDALPADLVFLLREFVPPPRPFELPTRAELPATVPLRWKSWRGGRAVEEQEEVPLRVRDTAREALHDVKAVLRLAEAGKLRVSDKKRQPTAASQKALVPVLQGGDFYSTEDQEADDSEPAADLSIKAFAWPMILQAAGLAQKAGDQLQLTPAGRKALAKPAPEVIRAAWQKWRTGTLLDEFSRVEAIKGQGKGQLSALAARRKAVIDGLAEAPAGLWFAVDDFFRFLVATGRDFALAHAEDNLYIADHYYGSLGNAGGATWELLQGRYVLAVFFEYAATLGVLDVAYVPPQGARRDYSDLWGTEDLSCLSRYDGLVSVRINPLGAWCLGRAERYEEPALAVAEVVRVLPNLDVVVREPPPAPADRLLLERFADQESDAVWKLSREKALVVLEQGGSLDELADFLTARGAGPLPETVRVFLDDLRRQAARLRDLGLARLIECADAATAEALAADRLLRDRCWRAGERWLVFPTDEEAALRKALRQRGYILPPPAR